MLEYEEIEPYVFVTKLAGFEHTEYIQPNATHEPKSDSDIPMVQGKNIRNGKFVDKYDWYIAKEISDSLPRSTLKKDCILIPYVGSNLGEVGVFYHTKDCHLASNVAKIELTSNSYDIEYLKYYLQSPIGQSYLFQTKQGSAQPNITMDSIRKTKVIKRDLPTQKKIADVLSCIDDKIALNNKTNSELENMAKTVYDYWFTQFDFPDANGNPYKTSGGKMEYNQVLKREIPAGWEVGKLSEIANITMGQSPDGESYNENGEGTIFYQGSTDFGTRSPSIRVYTTAPTRFAKVNDILMSVRAPVGTLNIANTDCCIGRGLAALNSKTKSISFLYCIMRNFQRQFELLDSIGTTFGSITKDDLFGLQVVIPKQEVIDAFDKIGNEIFEKQSKLNEENEELTKLRDYLLPLLMNGQIEVK